MFEPAVFTRCISPVSCGNTWDGKFWRDIPHTVLSHFHAKSSEHHPLTAVKLAYSDLGIAVCFRVEDRYVICRNTAFMSNVCQDSCVEFFFAPGGADGYFNFEINCGGTLHASYTRHADVQPGGGYARRTAFTEADRMNIGIFPDLPQIIDPELSEPVTWTLAFYVPFEVLARYCGKSAYDRENWRGNFYKCANSSSHPHWGSWCPVEPLNFHQPDSFGELQFQEVNS